MNGELLRRAANLPKERFKVFLPKLLLEPERMMLSDDLKRLGVRSAFNEPAGSANFDRMAPQKGLFVSAVIHKTFLSLDEKGTEAAAATAISVGTGGGPLAPPPEIHIDRPLIFAIQHRPSGACLFLGRVVDPRQNN